MFENKVKKSSQRISTSKVHILLNIVNITSKTNKKITNLRYFYI